MAQTLLGLTAAELEQTAAGLGLPRYTARQIARWLYVRRATDIEEMTDLSKTARSRLAETYTVGRMQPVHRVESADGTVKYLFPTAGGKRVETVYIPDGDRATLCVSSQVGCKMRCAFCQTGRQGFEGSLTAGDILNQILSLPEADKLTNVVFMGQGEPMDNLDAVLRATDILTAGYSLAWSPKRITVSTVGINHKVKRFLDTSQCHLAVSLHSPFHDERLAIMPAERQMPAADIVELLRQYDWTGQRRVTFEYIVFAGLNDTPRHARALAQLLGQLECRVNLIRFHDIPDSPFRAASADSMAAFRDSLNRLGLTATIRASRGQDIYAACGLLNTKVKERETDNRP